MPEPEPVGEDKKIKFVFHRTADYRMVAANAVWGGITPRGDILAEFAVEGFENPETVTNLVKSDGALGDELSRTPRETNVRRELQVGVILSGRTAESIGQWLLIKAAELKKLGQGDQPEKDDGR